MTQARPEAHESQLVQSENHLQHQQQTLSQQTNGLFRPNQHGPHRGGNESGPTYLEFSNPYTNPFAAPDSGQPIKIGGEDSTTGQAINIGGDDSATRDQRSKAGGKESTTEKPAKEEKMTEKDGTEVTMFQGVPTTQQLREALGLPPVKEQQK